MNKSYSLVQCAHNDAARRVDFEIHDGAIEAAWCRACGAFKRDGVWESPEVPSGSAGLALRAVVAGLAVRDEAFRSLLAALEREKALARKAIGVCSDLERLQTAIKEVLDAHANGGA